MLRLRKAMQEAGISQARMAAEMGRCPKHFSKILCGHVQFRPKFRQAVSDFMETGTELAAALRQWMEETGCGVADLFEDMPGEIRQHQDKHSRTNQNITAALNTAPIIPGDPDHHQPHPQDRSRTMITLKVMKHFHLKRNPFLNDVRDISDIFFSADHLFIKNMITETALNEGLTAVWGEVGSGKSTMRKAVYRELLSQNCRVIYPMILDKTRINASNLLDAIILDISDQNPKRALEAKTRQAYEALKERSRGGLKQVLIIEEAHLLTTPAMKYVKQIWEFEDGYRRLCGCVLIGQTELGVKMDEAQYPQLRELIRRTARVEIKGLPNDDIGRYLQHKLSRSNGSGPAPDIFTSDAIEAIAVRLSKSRRDGSLVSEAFPLSVNNIASAGMNAAAAYGEEKVTGEIIHSL